MEFSPSSRTGIYENIASRWNCHCPSGANVEKETVDGTMIPAPDDLRAIYEAALADCAPAVLVARQLAEIPPREGGIEFIAAGKCADELARGVMASREVRRGLILAPRGYARGLQPHRAVRRVEGSHPDVSESSAVAARAAIEFSRASDGAVLALVSGGASACIEAPLEPWFSLEQVAAINATLVRSGLDIAAINTVRKHLSAVKGGRLGALLPAGSVALVHSDVARGRIELVGSGLFLPDPSTNADAARILEAIDDRVCRDAARALRGRDVPDTPKEVPVAARLIADNDTLVAAACAAAAARGLVPIRIGDEVSGDVEDAARMIARRAIALEPGALLIAGGEPTVVVHGNGRGGRCSELALRVARLLPSEFVGLFGSSDGIDGSSPAGAIVMTRGVEGAGEATLARIADALGRCSSYDVVGEIGEAIIMEPTGNNLRDIFLVARGSGHAG